MHKCMVCGNPVGSNEFGKYCCKGCRDSDLAVLGKTFCCEQCGLEFKSMKKLRYCHECEKSYQQANSVYVSTSSGFSSFKYSIFEDNVQRIIQAASHGDKRNCMHAANVISNTIDSSMLPEVVKVLENSNEKTKFWLVDVVARMNDKSAIKYLEKLKSSPDTKLQAKATEAINILQGA